jgi:hypothetical protein
MKSIILQILFSILFVTQISAQSYFAISLGRDLGQYRELEDKYMNYQDFWVEDHSYASKSMFYAISGEKNISKKFSLNLNLSFTKKEVEISTEALVKICGIRFSSFRSMLSLKLRPNNYWYTGSGFVLHYLSNFRDYNIYGNENPFYIETYKKFGAVIYAGATYKNFFFEPYLIQGFWTFKRSKTVDLRPINSFGVSLGYRIRVSKK